MNRNDLRATLAALASEEVNRVQVNPHARYRVALMYPNTYFVGMSNLGLQIIYEEINNRIDSCAERVFLPSSEEWEAYVKTKTPLMSVESQRPLHDFDVIGIDVTFEMDYFHIPIMLKQGHVPVLAKERDVRDPIVIAGGPCATFNPEPFADFVDACVIGEGEQVISELLEVIYQGRENGYGREELLYAMSQVPGIYVPSLYAPQFDENQNFTGFIIADGAPAQVERQWRCIERPAETVVATNFTEFGAMYIVEVARGCGRHCRFCMAGYCYRTPRIRPLEMLKAGVDRAEKLGKKVGLMGAAISDYPYINELVSYIRSKGVRYSCASLRADSLTEEIVVGLANSGQKTITIAPEAGSERLRRVINKGITEADLKKSVDMAALAGIPHIRLYIMIGLPTETQEDIQAIVDMAMRVQAHMQAVGCKGRLTLSINPFIPKPFTPFQWMAMADQKEITKKLNFLKKSLQKNRRIEVLTESPREAYVQGVLARGDRRLGKIILAASEENGGKSFKNACKNAGFDMDAANYTERKIGEALPWQILDMQLQEGYLEGEWQRGIEGKYTMPCMEGCKRCGVCK